MSEFVAVGRRFHREIRIIHHLHRLRQSLLNCISKSITLIIELPPPICGTKQKEPQTMNHKSTLFHNFLVNSIAPPPFVIVQGSITSLQIKSASHRAPTTSLILLQNSPKTKKLI